MKKKEIVLKLSKNDPAVGYVYLPNHLGPPVVNGGVDKQISLYDLMGEYIGPSIYLDFKNGELVGIEILS